MGIVGDIIGGIMGSGASKEAAKIQADAAKYGMDLMTQAGQQAVGLQQPYYEAGARALPQFENMPGFKAPTVTDDPGYQFRLQQGQQALERSAAARGGLLTGGTVKATERYAQGMASDEYARAYDRALTEYNLKYRKLSDLTGIGESAASRAGSFLTGTAADVGAAKERAGAYQAGGVIGSTQSWLDALNSANAKMSNLAGLFM